MSGLNSSTRLAGFGVVRHGSVSEDEGSRTSVAAEGMHFLNRARHAEAMNIIWRVGKENVLKLLWIKGLQTHIKCFKDIRNLSGLQIKHALFCFMQSWKGLNGFLV